MKPNIDDHIKPNGIYTGAQIIKLAGIPSSTFYHYVKQNKIPKHERNIDGRTVYFGFEVLHALTTTKEKKQLVNLNIPRRGRPRKRF